MLDFVERLADETGLPVGIKSAVGMMDFWRELADQISTTGRSVDFITVDGGEGGTGAAPLAFADHVAMPFKLAISNVYRVFMDADLEEKIVFIGSGKLGFPDKALLAFGLGCDMINVGREAMLAIGCIQAQRCHTGHCPTGVATQNRWLAGGLDPNHKSHRFANYAISLRKELLQLSRACGVDHPSKVSTNHLEIVDGALQSRTVTECFGYHKPFTRRVTG
jgi:glutamate synthase (ferredoxin)